VPVKFPGISVDFVLDSGSFRSAISSKVHGELSSLGLLEHVGRFGYRIRGGVIEESPIPDIVVRVSPRVDEAGARALLGLDFLLRFAEIRFEVATLMLTLIP
jgi:hypothetical protein